MSTETPDPYLAMLPGSTVFPMQLKQHHHGDFAGCRSTRLQPPLAVLNGCGPRISWPAAHLGLPGLESTFRENSRVVLALQHPTTCVRSGSEHGGSHRCRRLGEVALAVA